MPSAALKACSYPGCVTLVPSGRCELHRIAEMVYRNHEAQYLYGRAAWKARRVQQLAGQPWCEMCLADEIYTAAVDVHHVQRHEGDVNIFLSSPLQSLCHACHSKVTLQELRNG